MDFITLTIRDVITEVDDFKTFVFENDHHITYKAGQYLTFVHHTPQARPDNPFGREEVRRSYSIVSSPGLNEPLSIGVKRIANGIFSRALVDHAQRADKLLCSGAGGFFVLPEDIAQYKQVFFFAAGSGITPVLSLLKSVLYQHAHLYAVLVYSNHSTDKIVYLKSIQELYSKFPGRFRLEFLFSTSPFLDKARLNREMLVQLVEEYSLSTIQQTLFYICGPEAYMRMCTYALQEEQVPKENIRKENFVIEKKQPPKAEPPDKSAHAIIIHHRENNYSLLVKYPDTILQAAKKKNIELPYSCETGRCGNCVAKCVKGKVWLSYNEVLTDAELNKGLTLTCVGHPVYGDVELEIR